MKDMSTCVDEQKTRAITSPRCLCHNQHRVHAKHIINATFTELDLVVYLRVLGDRGQSKLFAKDLKVHRVAASFMRHSCAIGTRLDCIPYILGSLLSVVIWSPIRRVALCSARCMTGLIRKELLLTNTAHPYRRDIFAHFLPYT